MQCGLLAGLGLAGAVLAGSPAAAEVPNVVTSVRPVQSLVAAVMAGIGRPRLVVEQDGSPHGHALRPSQARALSDADAVFWIGPQFEQWLVQPLDSLAAGALHVALIDAPDVAVLPLRASGSWQDHAGHEGGDGLGPSDEEAHDGYLDGHIWLDPDNAAAMAAAAARTLAALDPANAAIYDANAAALVGRIEALDRDIADSLAPFADRPYLVFHDAYQYFETHYGLRPVGSVKVSPETQVSAARLAEIEQRVGESGAACVFAEPQFRPALVESIADDTGIRHGVLDPLGTATGADEEDYFALMRGLAGNLEACLGGSP